MRKFDVEQVKIERQAMSALEMLAELETIYRRNSIKYKPQGDLEFKSSSQYFLRDILDEPIGRYYFEEFCQKKEEFNACLGFVTVWRYIHLLKYDEVTLEDVMKIKEAEEEAILENSRKTFGSGKTPMAPSGTILRKFAKNISKMKGRVTSNKFERPNKSEDDKSKSEGLLVTVEDESKQDSLEMAKQLRMTMSYKERKTKNSRTRFTTSIVLDEDYSRIAENSIHAASGQKMRELADYDFILTTAEKIIKTLSTLDFDVLSSGLKEEFEKENPAAVGKATSAIESEDHKSLSQIFEDVQILCFKAIMEQKAHHKFKKHSEYTRYKNKYKLVYNFISIKDFEYMQTIGKGSFGRVIRVRKKTTRDQYALKVMSKKRILSGAEMREQATIEKEVLSVCFSSPFVVGLQYAFQTSKALFLALDLLQGGTLSDMIKRYKEKKVPVDCVRVVAMQIILGLNHLHLHGILYRDLKPGNVLLDLKGNAVLTDMGLCAKYKVGLFDTIEDKDNKRVKEELILPLHHTYISKDEIRDFYSQREHRMPVIKKKGLKCVGTPSYRAPEVLSITSSSEIKKKKKKKNFVPNRSGYEHEADYWALGVTLYYLLQGHHPFRTKNAIAGLLGPSPDHRKQELSDQKNVPDFEKEFKGRDPHIADLLRGLLTVKTSDRYGHDIKQLQRHPFFVKYDFKQNCYTKDAWEDDKSVVEKWRTVLSKEVRSGHQPPQKKRPDDEKPRFKDLGEAMRQFAQENVLELFGGGEHDIVEDFRRIKLEQQAFFDHWNHIPDTLLTKDWDLFDEYFSVDI